jgi:hypothetical protein
MNDLCMHMHSWLLHNRGWRSTTPPEEMVAHIAGCSHCRSSLLLLLTNLLDPPAPSLYIACADIEFQLAAFVDLEQTKGLQTAVHTFPDAWWHTLHCPECSALYQDLQKCAQLPEVPWVAPIGVNPSLDRRNTFPVQNQVLQHMLRHLLLLGSAWNTQSQDMLINKYPFGSGMIEIMLRPTRDNSFELVVQTHPPVEGVAVVRFAGLDLRAPLNAEGYATINGLKAEQFATIPTGLSLVIESLPIEPCP